MTKKGFIFAEGLKTEYIRKMTTEIDRRAQMEYAKRVGLEKGLAEGREEEKLSTARKMKAAGISNELICQCTGLSIDEVQNL